MRPANGRRAIRAAIDGSDSTPVNAGRRGFLRAAAGAGALGALAAAAPPLVATPAPAAAAPAQSLGYHETEHIRQYYRTARYW